MLGRFGLILEVHMVMARPTVLGRIVEMSAPAPAPHSAAVWPPTSLKGFVRRYSRILLCCRSGGPVTCADAGVR